MVREDAFALRRETERQRDRNGLPSSVPSAARLHPIPASSGPRCRGVLRTWIHACIIPGVMGARPRAVALPLVCSVAICLLGCQKQSADTETTPASSRALSGTLTNADPAALQQDDGQWVMPAKNYASTRFSGLTEINTGNVRQLGVRWTFSTGMVDRKSGV